MHRESLVPSPGQARRGVGGGGVVTAAAGRVCVPASCEHTTDCLPPPSPHAFTLHPPSLPPGLAHPGAKSRQN
ncbi:hypothetical protein E2C01_064544 [Portunus trituberculatus]|uniref:Uncharacterized protein n=1 Tax=Portunus trituberculatus TaxID=210409 RepID=A0A5B7HDA5_PORTR|nr:hypothetical protein [Portunus trituberculatus]